MRWPSYKHVFFDCDSTLTTVEGIELLAESAGEQQRIEGLTRAAMDGELELEEVYAERLRALRPTRRRVRNIRREYKRNIVEDAQEVIAALQALGHEVYIISGGLAVPVIEFGLFLGVPRENIRAVDLRFDALSGQWWMSGTVVGVPENDYLDYDEGALTVSDGKAQIVKELLGNKRGRSLLIGDGTSDLLAGSAVDLFVGFGGVIRRDKVVAEAPCFIESKGLAPFLALAAGPAGLEALQNTEHQAVAMKALDQLSSGAITFQDERIKEKFRQAYSAVHSRPN